MSEPTGATATTDNETREEQVNVRFSTQEKADLVRRAGEQQAASGEVVKLNDYIRSLLFPDGISGAA